MNIHPPRIILKFKDNIDLPYSRDVNEKIDFPFWRRLRSRYNHIILEPLFISIKPENLDQLINLARKMTPSYKPPNFFTYFAVDTQGIETKAILADLNRNHDEIEYLYLEATPSEQLEPEKPNIIYPKNENESKSPKQKNQKNFRFNQPETAAFEAEGKLEQKYIKCSPMGIGLENLLNRISRTGLSMDDLPNTRTPHNYFFDVERGWVLSHQDLLLLEEDNLIIASGTGNHTLSNKPFDVIHGTSTLGVVSSIHNTFGTKGLSYHSTEPRGASTYFTDSDRIIYSVANSILSAKNFLLTRFNNGDENAFLRSVILIEEQLNIELEEEIFPYTNMIAEADPAIFDVIQLTTSLKVTVIEAAGNGEHNFDKLSDDYFPQLQEVQEGNPNDSGALVVGSADCNGIEEITDCRSDNITWMKREDSSYGKRVNCFAWGSQVVTLATVDEGSGTFAKNLYRDNFGGTSSAAAIIAGAALITQKMAYVKLGRYLRPDELRGLLDSNLPTGGLRDLLGSIEHGVLNEDNADHFIGVMPDLEHIASELLRVEVPPIVQ